MKPHCSNRRNQALTLVEVLVIVAVLAILATLLLPVSPPTKRINCKNNLEQISLAFRTWAGDNNDSFPMEVSVTNGGTMELASAGNAVTTFQIMSNELVTPKVLFCPADTRRVWATNFSTDFDNSHISYFIGVDADKNHPQAFLTGDDNFAINGIPVRSGRFELSTNGITDWARMPVDWTGARHKARTGNICLVDGSIRETYFYSLRDYFYHTGLATNRLSIP